MTWMRPTNGHKSSREPNPHNINNAGKPTSLCTHSEPHSHTPTFSHTYTFLNIYNSHIICSLNNRKSMERVIVILAGEPIFLKNVLGILWNHLSSRAYKHIKREANWNTVRTFKTLSRFRCGMEASEMLLEIFKRKHFTFSRNISKKENRKVIGIFQIYPCRLGRTAQCM